MRSLRPQLALTALPVEGYVPGCPVTRGPATRSLRVMSLAAMWLACLVLAAPAEAAPGDILVADANAFGGQGAIFRVDPATGAQTTVSSKGILLNPTGLALTPSGDILVADQNADGDTGAVIRVDPASGTQTIVSSRGYFSDPSGIALAPDGALLVTDPKAFGGTGGVIKVDPTTGAQTPLSHNAAPPGEPAFADPFGIAPTAGGDILVADYGALGGSGAVIRVKPASGARSTVSSGGSLSDPAGIAIAADGDIAVADFRAPGGHGSVIRVDPATGEQTPLSVGGSFVDPGYLAFEADGDLLVSDAAAFGGRGAIIRVDSAGAQSTVSSGASFVDPRGIAIVPPAPARPTPRPPAGPTPAPRPLPDTSAPAISRLSVSPRSFATRSSRRHRRAGTIIRYALSESARVRFTIHRRIRGRLVGERCRSQTKGNRRARRCVLYRHVGSLTQDGAAGENRRAFSGRLRGSRLPPGAYRLRLRATDTAGNESPAARTVFRVVAT